MRKIISFQSLFIGLTLLAIIAKGSEFCWRNSYGRGVGKVPASCQPGREKIGLLCYTRCPQGMSRFGFDCHSTCPQGWRDDGLFCRLAEYGRGAGFPWQFGDPLSDRGMYQRCERAHGAGNCEKWGAVVYPKCRTGYSPAGCCICRPTPPNCRNFNLNPGIDLSCAKRIIIGDPVSGDCGREDKSGGLCYPPCQNTYKGIGPVCWGAPPSRWVECGMGAAVSSTVCASTIVSQITSVGNLVLTIATLGSSTAATAASKVARLSSIADKMNDVKKIFERGRKAFDKVEGFKAKYDALNNVIEAGKSDDLTAEDIVRISAEIAALIDPTGVADVVAAYTYPKCSAITVKKRGRNFRDFY